MSEWIMHNDLNLILAYTILIVPLILKNSLSY